MTAKHPTDADRRAFDAGRVVLVRRCLDPASAEPAIDHHHPRRAPLAKRLEDAHGGERPGREARR